ncbi:MAG TPA: hypothetical protein ENI49_05120 [Thermoplasmatales archaeon]|nr:hypothetical protein [Thermoplasmatales archaeon]
MQQPLVIGNVTVEVEMLNFGYGIRNVSFYVDGDCVYVDEEYPFEMVLGDCFVGERNITVVACDLGGQLAKDEVKVFVWNLGFLSRFVGKFG